MSWNVSKHEPSSYFHRRWLVNSPQRSIKPSRYTLDLPPRPGCQSPPGWHYKVLGSGNPKKTFTCHWGPGVDSNPRLRSFQKFIESSNSEVVRSRLKRLRRWCCPLLLLVKWTPKWNLFFGDWKISSTNTIVVVGCFVMLETWGDVSCCSHGFHVVFEKGSGEVKIDWFLCF